MQKSSLTQTIRILLFFVLTFGILYIAKPVLVPLTIAAVIAMLLLPFCNWLERKGSSRGFSSFIGVLSFLLVATGIGALLGWQISDISSDLTQLEKNVTKQIDSLQQYLSNTFGISKEQQQKMLEQQQKSGSGGMSKAVTAIMSSLMGILVDTILMLVYMFLLLYFRTHLKNFVLKLVPATQKDKTRDIMNKSGKVVQQYLLGLGMMIVMLWVMYGIGFSIAGVKHAIFFAILCGLLEIIPFVGNLTGTALTLLMALSQGGGSGVVIGILITYVLVQFIQSYILEPLVVGAEVNINPLFTILIIVIGEMVWGVAGMVLAIPVLGMVKIICDHIESLQPYGYLIGKEKKEEKGGMIKKLKNLFSQ